MPNTLCPICEMKVYFSRISNEAVCKKCGYELRLKDGQPVYTLVTRLVKLKYWIKTNWYRLFTKLGDKVIDEKTVYKSHCWNCKEPITAVAEGTNFHKWLGNHLYGNKQCSQPDCNHFICKTCGMCLCDSPYYKNYSRTYEIKEIDL